jgi:hypothetical protein
MLSVERIFTHPGEMLREEFMLPMRLSANALAMGINVPASRILDKDAFEFSCERRPYDPAGITSLSLACPTDAISP